MTEVPTGATITHNQLVLTAYSEELIHAYFVPLKILFGNLYYSWRHTLRISLLAKIKA